MRAFSPFVIAAFAALAFTPAHADVLIRVNKAAQRMTVIVDGEQRYTWPVSTGVAHYDTPDGEFKPFRMEAEHFSREWDDAPMPHSIFFTQQGHAIHGTYHKSLGRPASHGCVRISAANAATLFALVKQEKMANTRVVLTGEIPESTGAAVARRARDPGAVDSDDNAGALLARRARNTRGWNDNNNDNNYDYGAPPAYYDREQPADAPPRYEQRGLFSFGW
jgi:hypothetical protein